tara:strand:- start:563 stop:964 length:402 start_codon:yes stop_codon:yes gene_type:complete
MNNLVKITGLSAYNRTYFENEDSGVLSWIIDMDKIRIISTAFNDDVVGTIPKTENEERYLKTRITMFDGGYLSFNINVNLGGVGNEIENALADLIDARTSSDKYNQMKVLDCSKIINFEFIEDSSQWYRLYDY